MGAITRFGAWLALLAVAASALHPARAAAHAVGHGRMLDALISAAWCTATLSRSDAPSSPAPDAGPHCEGACCCFGGAAAPPTADARAAVTAAAVVPPRYATPRMSPQRIRTPPARAPPRVDAHA
jgi:hypothetical protein